MNATDTPGLAESGLSGEDLGSARIDPELEGAAAIRARREGPIGAALLSASIGIFVLGVASVINQALNPTEWIPPPGDQGGAKMILMWSNFAVMTGLLFVTLMAWIVSWVILHETLAYRRTLRPRFWAVCVALTATGLVLSFPLVYGWLFPGEGSAPAPLRMGDEARVPGRSVA